jgi:hypothetical protein
MIKSEITRRRILDFIELGELKKNHQIPTKYRRGKNDRDYILDKQALSRNIAERQLRYQKAANYDR